MTDTLTPGMTVQYRRVGQARLVSYRMESAGNEPRETGEGWWTVEWIKAPKKYRDRQATDLFWICRRDVIEHP